MTEPVSITGKAELVNAEGAIRMAEVESMVKATTDSYMRTRVPVSVRSARLVGVVITVNIGEAQE
jgi:hypothetical protein